jgi:hypothetical protein
MNLSERMLFRVLQTLGVPVIPQAQVGPYTVDFLLPDQRTVVEADGRPYHTSPDDTRHDRERDRHLQGMGYLTIHVWADYPRTPEGAAKAWGHVVRRLYLERGWRSPERRAQRLYQRLDARAHGFSRPDGYV